MENNGPKWWHIGLILLAGVYLTIVVLVLGLQLMTDISWRSPAILVLSGLIIGYGVFSTYEKRRAQPLSLSLSLAGIILILSGSIILLPYVTTKDYLIPSNEDVSSLIHGIPNTNDSLASYNGSLKEIALSPYSTKTYFYEGYGIGINMSIFHISVSASGPLRFVMAEPAYREENSSFEAVFLNETYFSLDSSNNAKGYYWTPSWQVYTLEFQFTNLSNNTISFRCGMTTVWFYAIATESTTTYRSLCDPILAPIGLFIICAAVAVNEYSNRISDKIGRASVLHRN